MKKASLFIILIILATFGVAVAAQYKVITKDAPVRKDKRFFAPVSRAFLTGLPSKTRDDRVTGCG